MTRKFRNVVVYTGLFFVVLIVIGLFSLSAQSATKSAQSATSSQSADCREMKKDIAEMKEDLKDYQKEYSIDSEDKTDLTKEASDAKKDFNEYLADPQSDSEEKANAEEGLKLVSQMEDGINQNNIHKVLSNYAKIIELYEWFYQDEDCK